MALALLGLLAVASAACGDAAEAEGDGRAHERRLGLDLGPFDAHLSRVDRCLRLLPEQDGPRGARRADCVAFADIALARCEDAFSDQLDTCMSQEDPPTAVSREDLLPELQQLRQDVIRCYDTKGLRPLSVQTLDGPLKRCGIVQLVRVLPKMVLEHTEEHIRSFLAHRESFHNYHPLSRTLDEEAVDSVHSLPLNLPGGRFEVVPPADGDILGLVSWLTSHFNTPSHVTGIWGHDHRDQAQLAYIVVRSQLNDTQAVVDQPWHQDRETTEDVRAQVAVHEWTEEHGPLEFMPTSHRMHSRLRPPEASYPRPHRVATASTGDMLFHFPRLRHRGTKRSGSRVKVTLDLVLHSTGRKYHAESERDQQHVHNRVASKPHARDALERFKELWDEKTSTNREMSEYEL